MLNTDNNAWPFMYKQELKKLHWASLTSIYGSIFVCYNAHLVRYDTAFNSLYRYVNSGKLGLFAAIFSRSARLIYSVMGFQDSSCGSYLNTFSVFDIKESQYGKVIHSKIALN